MIETRKRSTILNLVIAAIILLIAFLFWPSGSKFAQSNKIDVSETQIKILLRRINIRKEPDVDSEDIGDVFRGEIYTVLDHVEKNDYYWYKIKTDNDIYMRIHVPGRVYGRMRQSRVRTGRNASYR